MVRAHPAPHNPAPNPQSTACRLAPPHRHQHINALQGEAVVKVYATVSGLSKVFSKMCSPGVPLKFDAVAADLASMAKEVRALLSALLSALWPLLAALLGELLPGRAAPLMWPAWPRRRGAASCAPLIVRGRLGRAAWPGWPAWPGR